MSEASEESGQVPCPTTLLSLAAPSTPPNEQQIQQGQSICGLLTDISVCLSFLLCELGQERLEVTRTSWLVEELTANPMLSPRYR